MPAVNPFIDAGANIEAMDGSPVNFAPSSYTIRQQDPRPGAATIGRIMNTLGGTTSSVNAAGSSENVSMHIALWVAAALLGVYVFNKAGFKFAVAGSVG